ncbi:HAD family hydrolase [Halostella sp. JP-L12]|uniref:HAD family hydrolase n=1 Tax=Halostella TaxID=1843185 RepID=UPI000EF77493|nr:MULTISPECIES: HAD family hydrolase [Halostella]NHN48460.1 HAD family hydrolase [Halostella sp. JP-L12]
MRYDAILFDHDGVITTPPALDLLHAAARETFAEAGVESPPDQHVEGLALGVTVDWLDGVCAEYGLDRDEFWSLRDGTAAAFQREAIRDGEKTLYDDVPVIGALDHDLGIVSTNQHETIEFVLEHFDLADRFETYYGREPTVESVRRKKPNPHYVERAMSDLSAERALFVGDSETDVEAARNAGIDSAYLHRPHCDGALTVEPTYELDSLTDLHDLPGVRTADAERSETVSES